VVITPEIVWNLFFSLVVCGVDVYDIGKVVVDGLMVGFSAIWWDASAGNSSARQNTAAGGIVMAEHLGYFCGL